MVNQSELFRVLSAVDRPTKASLVDLDTVTDDLAAAFVRYPICNWILREDSNHDASYTKLFRVLIQRIGYPLGDIYRPSTGGAVAIWIPSEKLYALSVSQYLYILMELFEITGIERLRRLVEIHKAMNIHHPKVYPYHYLFLLGVHPRFQGKGIGSRLMYSVLNQVDLQDRGAFLETSVDANIPFFEKFGFKVTDYYDISLNSPPTWSMWRPPKSSGHYMEQSIL